MISDEDVRQLFQNNHKLWPRDKPLYSEFYRGVSTRDWEDQHPGRCEWHMSVFNKFNIIPKYCFSCYKVFIEPRTVVELFKLMIVFEKIKLADDNTRKCCVERRDNVSGTYKGFVYCRGLEEGKELCESLKKVISGEISAKVPVTLKRGCSEYAIAYPEYGQIGQDTVGMEYKEEWEMQEYIADKEFVVGSGGIGPDTYNHPEYTPLDVTAMVSWLVYAATIGDLSYLNITGATIPPANNLIRPPFQPVEDE